MAKSRYTSKDLDLDEMFNSVTKDESKDTQEVKDKNNNNDEPKDSQGPGSIGGIGLSSSSISSEGVGPSTNEKNDLDIKERFVLWIFIYIEPCLEPTLDILKNIYL